MMGRALSFFMYIPRHNEQCSSRTPFVMPWTNDVAVGYFSLDASRSALDTAAERRSFFAALLYVVPHPLVM